MTEKIGCVQHDCAECVAREQRTWVGLTDEDVKACLGPEAARIPPGWRKVTQAIEAKLKEKNT